MIIALQTLIFFRQTLLSALDRLLGPYYKRLTLTFSRYSPEDEDEDEEVFAEFDEEKGVVFYPPMYVQRYAAVSDCLMDPRWCGKLEKVVDLGYHDMSFIKYLKEMEGIRCIMGVDIESIPLRCSSDLLGCEEYAPKRESPLQVTLFQGNAADPDYRLIGCDAVIAIEMIEHMLPHDLDRLVHTVFGFIKPWIAIFTTPNSDFNPLFKALEKNGLRRLDHFFEWSREQFHDWCSNIVTRYPQFTVTCLGVGPGPPGTQHLGCCSQLALFVNKNYVKQQDLNINSLALVSNVPSPHNITDMIGGWESPINDPENFIYPEKLNCTTFQVTKFSKTTQNLMAKNKVDSLIHTREVVNEIRHLTKMLNFNKEALTQKGENGHVWHNINWGDDAPYWNQYYQVVREFNYPFETKSDECRILDLISEEINRMIDAQYDEEFSTDVNKLEIPMDQLMRVVRHITNDVEKVKDLLEWNGYEIVGNVVIHSRMVVHGTSMGSCDDDWPENDTVSDIDTTDIHSTSISDASTIAADYPGRCLARALDKKVRELRAMLSADEDITSELDRVVCRLMKLALRSSKGKQAPPPTRWMQCKLLDLLTLTEKAISRRRRQYLDQITLKALGYDRENTYDYGAFERLKKDDRTVRSIMNKYNHLIEVAEIRQTYDPLGFGFEDDLGDQESNDFFKDFELSEIRYSIQSESVVHNVEEKLTTEQAQAWMEANNIEIVPYPDHAKALMSSSDQSTSNGARHRYKKSRKRIAKADKSCKRSQSRILDDKSKPDDKKKNKNSKTSLVKTVTRKKSASNNIAKNYGKKLANEFRHYGIKSKRVIKEPKKLQPTASKPIPGSLIELCHPDLSAQNSHKRSDHRGLTNTNYSDVAATEESVLIDIIMDDREETIALRRSIGTDPDMDFTTMEQEEFLNNVESVAKDDSTHDKLQVTSESVQSQTIFLYDINEPSTSKGVRHVGMDVQCGTDSVTPADYGSVMPPSSVTKIPKVFSNGIRIGDSLTNVTSKKNSLDFINNDIQNFGPVCSRIKPIFAKGIKIEDSPDNLFAKRHTDLSISVDDDREQLQTTRTTKIRIKNSSFDVRRRTSSECGTSTQNPSENETVSPILNSSGVMTDENIADSFDLSHASLQTLTKGIAGDKLINMPDARCNQKNIDFGTSPNDIAEEYVTMTARPESPESFIRSKRKDSLTNILSNFNNFVNRRYTGRGSPPGRSPIRYSTGIRIHDSIPEIGISSDIGAPENEKGKHRESETCRIISPRVKSPVIFKYRVKNSLNGSSHTDVGTYTNEIDCKHVEQSSEVSGSLTDLTKYKSETSHCSDSPRNIKTGDSFSDMKQNNADAYTNAMKCINRSLSLSPKTISFGIKVKDFDANLIKKLEISTTRVELMSDCNPSLLSNRLESPTKTELLKPVSSAMKTEDSCSEYCGSNYFNSSPLRVTNSSLNASDLRVKESSSKDGLVNSNSLSPTRLRRKLSCGGVHIHSYKEKQVCEDIVYQGEWQRQVPQIPRKRKIPVVMKKVPEVLTDRTSPKKVFPRERTFSRKPDKKNDVKVEQKKSVQVRNMKTIKLKQEVVNITGQFRRVTRPSSGKPNTKINNKNSSIPTLVRTVKVNKNVTKVSSKITMSSVPPKNTRNVHIAKKPTTNLSSYMKKDIDTKTEPIKRKDVVKKSYLPPYLRKRKLISNQSNLNQSSNSAHTIIKVNKDSAKECLAPLIQPETGDPKSDMIKYHNIPCNDISYIVFRNELESTSLNVTNSQTTDNSTTKTETNNRRTNSNNRSSSPMSQNSSTCSTPDSIATVRAMSTRSKVSTRRHSTSSNKSSMGNTDSETAAPVRNRKLTKRIKTNKKADVKDSNKENLPESSANCLEKGLQIVKSAFMGRSKNIFMAQFATDSNAGLNIKHQTPTKSSVKIPAVENNEDKKKMKSVNINKKKSSQSNDSSFTDDIKNQGSPVSENSNMVFLLEPCTQVVQESISQAATSEEQVDVVKVVDSNLLTEWLESGNAVERDNTEKAILAAMRQIVEERLEFIDSSSSQVYAVETTSTIDGNDIDDSSSLKSYKTVILTSAGVIDLNNTLTSEIENVMNHSLDAITGDESGTSLGYETGTNELDLLSFKSISSTPRYSEYFSADNERTEHSTTGESSPRAEVSVRDIFERKDINFAQPTPGVLATQAFSGFSMNAEPVIGDQPDYVNLVDSETGSVAADFTRQATSEELFVSGRSSESYESCVIDEDAVVPNWLFNIMNHQQAVDEEDEEEEDHQELVPLPMPLGEPVYDGNGNVVEPGIGLGAGAGDGRGMHSDHSQDSSGRGSSLSTTDTSSGQQSEAILIDPSAFTAQFELMHEPISSSMAVTALVVPVESPETLALRQGNEGQQCSTRSESIRMGTNPLLLTSDGEADVSSLDTDNDAPGDTDHDVPDSSDN